MCRPASFVLTKDRVFWSKKSDSHEDIIEEFELHSDGVRGPNIVRVEVTHRDMRTPLSEWKFEVVQDDLPPWHDPDVDESRARTALIEWAAHKLVIDRACEVIDGQVYAYGSSSVTAYGSSRVTAYGSGTVTAYGSSRVKAFGSSTVYAYDSSTVYAYGSSSVMAYGSSTVTAYDRSTVYAYGSSSVTAYGSSTVYAYGSSTVKAYGSGTVKACENDATVSYCSCTEPVEPIGPHATVIDSRGDKSVVIQDEMEE